mmetsp:Transcript_80375/g.260515  ORF Transcript_80375/g.260515 Transcript_80375/m.260515 type:complete len:367 (-) Transcript_80375:11-1111(-)
MNNRVVVLLSALAAGVKLSQHNPKLTRSDLNEQLLRLWAARQGYHHHDLVTSLSPPPSQVRRMPILSEKFVQLALVDLDARCPTILVAVSISGRRIHLNVPRRLQHPHRHQDHLFWCFLLLGAIGIVVNDWQVLLRWFDVDAAQSLDIHNQLADLLLQQIVANARLSESLVKHADRGLALIGSGQCCRMAHPRLQVSGLQSACLSRVLSRALVGVEAQKRERAIGEHERSERMQGHRSPGRQRPSLCKSTQLVAVVRVRSVRLQSFAHGRRKLQGLVVLTDRGAEFTPLQSSVALLLVPEGVVMQGLQDRSLLRLLLRDEASQLATVPSTSGVQRLQTVLGALEDREGLHGSTSKTTPLPQAEGQC